jgi:hypothetical protein
LLRRKMSKTLGTIRRSLQRASLALRRHARDASRDARRCRTEKDLRPQSPRAGIRSSSQTLSRLFSSPHAKRNHHERSGQRSFRYSATIFRTTKCSSRILCRTSSSSTPSSSPSY